MAGWAWDLRPDEDWLDASITHDGRVAITIECSAVDDGRTVTVDTADFEAMCHSFLDRMNDWRSRAAGGA